MARGEAAVRRDAAGVALNIAIFDVTTHAWDLAKATGQSTDLDPGSPASPTGGAGHAVGRPAGTGCSGSRSRCPTAPVADRLAGLAGAP
jgi:hypothetical protein